MCKNPATRIGHTRSSQFWPSLLVVAWLSACSDSDTGTPADDAPSAGPEMVSSPEGEGEGNDSGTGNEMDQAPDEPMGLFSPDPSDISIAPAVYEQDGYGEVNVIRMDVRIEAQPGICTEEDYDGCTLDDVIADTSHKDNYKPRVAVHFSADDFPDDGSRTNAELFQRGGTTRRADQKSFRIRLEDKDNLWRGERSVLLNKHPFERSRIRNKLAFDLMSEIPHLPSSRTQFVNLWMDDGAGPVDYGLFTHVEAPGSNYLEKRGFERSDNLYKTGFFSFSRSDLANVQVDEDGKPLDKDRFERSLEIEAGDDHRTLVEMLGAMHDPTRSFESILDQYFNRNNVLTWMAVNFLLHQTDAVTHNFILFNPEGSEKFYFLPWDYDGTFAIEAEPDPDSIANRDLQRRLFYGYARGSNSDFHRRYFALPGIHERLLEAVDELRRNYLTDANISERAIRYETVVRPFASRSPDIDFNPKYDSFAVEGFDDSVAGNELAMQTRFSVPIPPELEPPELVGSEWEFLWSRAVEVTGNPLTYDIQISSTVRFEPENIVYSAENVGVVADAGEGDMLVHRVDQAMIRPVDHYVRIIARAANDPGRYWQVNENEAIQDGMEWFGMEPFRGL